MGQLEKDKAKLGQKPDPEDDKLHCEAFALRIFGNADKVDRAGKATENTSKAYYAASIFLEVRSMNVGVQVRGGGTVGSCTTWVGGHAGGGGVACMRCALQHAPIV